MAKNDGSIGDERHQFVKNSVAVTPKFYRDPRQLFDLGNSTIWHLGSSVESDETLRRWGKRSKIEGKMGNKMHAIEA